MATQNIDASTQILSTINQAATAQAELQLLRTQQEQAQKDLETNAQQVDTEIVRFGDATRLVANITNSFVARTDATKAAVQAAASSDWNDAGSEIVKQTLKAREALQATDALRQEIHAKQQVQFFDNPLDYITNQIVLPSLRLKYNDAVGDYRSATGAVEELSAITTSGAKQAEDMQIKTSAALASATDDKIDAQIQEQRLKNKREDILGRISNYKDLQSLSGKSLEVAAVASRTALDYATYQATQENRQFIREQRGAIAEQRQERLDGQQAELGQYNLAADYLGAPKITNYATLDMLKRGKSPVLGNMLGLGQELIMSGGKTAAIAATPGEAVGVLLATKAKIGTGPGNEGSPAGLLRDVYSDVVKNPQLVGAKPDQISSAVDIEVKKRVDNYLSDIDTSDKKNPYLAPPIMAVYNAVSPDMKKTLDESAFFHEVLKPMSTRQEEAGTSGTINYQPTDPKLIIPAAAAWVKAGRGSLADASEGIRKFFAAAVIVNNKTKNYADFGLPPALGYRGVISSGMFGGDKTIELSQSTTDIERAVMMQMVPQPFRF